MVTTRKISGAVSGTARFSYSKT